MSAPRCRWHLDTGRCPGTVAAPGAAEVPELCPAHLAAIEPWARTRAQGGTADTWIAWAARRARDNEDAMRAAGILGPALSIAGRRAAALTAPERR